MKPVITAHLAYKNYGIGSPGYNYTYTLRLTYTEDGETKAWDFASYSWPMVNCPQRLYISSQADMKSLMKKYPDGSIVPWDDIKDDIAFYTAKAVDRIFRGEFPKPRSIGDLL